jgi:HD-GYP domain-containing protein (c-di-GMP phosphodiesterase class II)
LQKVIHKFIDHNYIPFKPSSLIEGTKIPFDCYIKRFENYVIIIEAGTLITKKLLDKIYKNDVIYILQHETKKLLTYHESCQNTDQNSSLDLDTDEIITAVLGLSQMLSRASEFDEKLDIVYSMTSNLMHAIFDKLDEKLPLNAIQESAQQIVEYTRIDSKTIHLLFSMMPEEYTTHNHSTNVAFLSVILGKAIGFTKEELTEIAFAGLMHDIGKIRIDKNLLLKPGPLNDDEYEVVKKHLEEGWIILQDNGITSKEILNGVRYHHEKLDGNNNYQDLHGKIISKFARILGISDIFDALTTKRTFRPNYTTFKALWLMKREMNTQVYESYINVFIHLLK